MSLLKLREYQSEALEEVHKEFLAGLNSQLIVLPTGSGKTILMAAIGKHFNKRMLLLAHREELIQQAFDKFKLYWQEADIGICKAEKEDTKNQIVIGSVQSCSRQKKLDLLKESGFDILMIDEAHHATADSYQKIINELGFRQDKAKLLIGVTATPNRTDKQCLSKTFKKITYSRSISTMIKAGYLSPAIGRKILTNFSLKSVRTQNGDFSIGDLSEAVNTPERNAFIAEKYKTYAAGRKGVAFCVDVKHCQELASAFEQVGIRAKAIWGDMPVDDRRKILQELTTGEIQMSMSCGVLTEGFDEPSINCIVMARPTKSQSLYIQCIGRGLRLWPGKQDCLVLDFTDGGHNLDSIISLSRVVPDTLEFSEANGVFQRDDVKKSSKIEILEECDKEFDILGHTRFIWIPIGDNEWSLIDDERREIIVRPLNNGYIADIFQNGSKTSIVSDPLPLEYCSGVCEDYARRHLKIAFVDMSAPWMSARVHPTQSQKELLQKHKAYNDGMTKAEASIEIRRIIAMKNKKKRRMSEEPITMKQKFTLMKTGINTNNMSKMQAMQEISRIKQTERVYG